MQNPFSSPPSRESVPANPPAARFGLRSPERIPAGALCERGFAGSAAVLQSAMMAVKGYRLTPARVRDYLQWSGDLVWDEKGQMFTPRIRLDKAIEMAIGTWVKFDYIGTELGTITEPFNTLAEAVNAVPDGGCVNIQAGSAGEAITINKAVTLQAWYGTTTIGQ